MKTSENSHLLFTWEKPLFLPNCSLKSVAKWKTICYNYSIDFKSKRGVDLSVMAVKIPGGDFAADGYLRRICPFSLQYSKNTESEVSEMSDDAKRIPIGETLAKISDISQFYKKPFVNYRGRTPDTGELYTEVIAKWVIDHLDDFQSMATLHRKSSYFTVGHDGRTGLAESNREEERIAMAMFRQGTLPVVGKILDYQTPLKNERCDHAGKIDLLAFDGKLVRILELKEPDSTETMLRCVLEGFTYLKTADTKKLIDDFNRDAGAGIPENTPVVACPFVFFGGEQYKEMQENRPMLKELMRLLDSVPVYIKLNN